MPVELSSRRFLREAAILKEETALSQMSFEAKIDQFRLEEEGEVQEAPTIQVSDTEDEPNRLSGVCTPSLVIAHIDNSSEEEEEEEMALNKKKGLRELLADRAKGSTPKDTPRSQPLPALPPSSSYGSPWLT